MTKLLFLVFKVNFFAVIYIVKFLTYSWLLPEPLDCSQSLSTPAAGQRDRRLWGRECAKVGGFCFHLILVTYLVA